MTTAATPPATPPVWSYPDPLYYDRAGRCYTVDNATGRTRQAPIESEESVVSISFHRTSNNPEPLSHAMTRVDYQPPNAGPEIWSASQAADMTITFPVPQTRSTTWTYTFKLNSNDQKPAPLILTVKVKRP